MTDLTDFLLARIAEDEASARAVVDLGHVVDMGGNRLDERWYVARLKFSSADGAARSEQDEPATELFARHDPARVLAECEAKRRIVEEHAPYSTPQRMVYGTITACDTCGSVDHSPVEWPCDTLRALAAVYADHADWREEWAP